ncbi:MAG TPA: GatB/YqeY domain-containing protein [Candidatus Cloacimonadota bacterium]|nr:GatB/YqeY domain-containing protein [Candidatus Cloacimonadota bacterium]
MKKIEDAFLDALRSKDKDRLRVLRSLKAALKYQEIEQKAPLTEEDVISVLQSQMKSREQAIELYRQGNRNELAENEQFEIEVIKSFLPKPLSEAEIASEVDAVITALQASSMKDMGNVMKVLKERIGSRADGRLLSSLVKAKLQA